MDAGPIFLESRVSWFLVLSLLLSIQSYDSRAIDGLMVALFLDLLSHLSKPLLLYRILFHIG